MRIRPATPDDIPALQELYAQVDALHHAEHPERFRKPAGPARNSQYLLDLLSGDPDESGMLIAEQSGRVVGMVYFLVYETANLPILTPRRLVMVDNLVVAESFRRRGAGLALMLAVEDWARVRGIDELELNVYEFNGGALQFYKQQGYRTISRRMWKRLEPRANR